MKKKIFLGVLALLGLLLLGYLVHEHRKVTWYTMLKGEILASSEEFIEIQDKDEIRNGLRVKYVIEASDEFPVYDIHGQEMEFEDLAVGDCIRVTFLSYASRYEKYNDLYHIEDGHVITDIRKIERLEKKP